MEREPLLAAMALQVGGIVLPALTTHLGRVLLVWLRRVDQTAQRLDAEGKMAAAE